MQEAEPREPREGKADEETTPTCDEVEKAPHVAVGALPLVLSASHYLTGNRFVPTEELWSLLDWTLMDW